MNSIQKIKASPHYLRLKESVEYRFHRKQFTVMAAFLGGMYLFMLLMFLPLMGSTAESNDITVAALVFLGILYAAFLLYFSYRWLEIFLYIDSYVFREVVLNRPQVGTRGGAKYTVTFTDRHGKPLTRETARMFTSQAQPLLEDYNNQTVLIGYNSETDRLVVIQRVGR